MSHFRQGAPTYLSSWSGVVGLGWWPFNGNANDGSGNGNDGMVNGASLEVDRFGFASSSYYFNGVDASYGSDCT